MSTLQRILKALEMQGSAAGHGLDALSGKLMASSPRLSGVADRLAGVAHRNPKATAAGVHAAGGLAGYGLAEGAAGLDSLSATGEPASEDEIMAEALEEAGLNPKKYRQAGRKTASGAVMGGSIGALAALGKKGKLAKYLALGALGGGVLGSGVETYKEK